MSSTPETPRGRHRTPGRRSPTAVELGAWREFVETSEAVRQQIERRLQQESGLSTGDYAVMVTLSDQVDRAMRSSELADAISWERSRLSHHLGRMERRGLVARRAPAGDSRGAEVVLTDAGVALYRKASAPHLHAIHDVFITPLSAEQLAAMEDAMRTIRARLNDRSG